MRRVIVDEHQRELAPHGTLLFPMHINHDDLSAFEYGRIACHWHEEMEFSVVTSGRTLYVLGGGTFVLSAGEGVFINANVPHALIPYGGNATLISMILHPSLVYGLPGSAIESGLIRPLAASRQLSFIRLLPDETNVCRAIASIEAARAFAWELRCKQMLCGLFADLLTRTQDKLDREAAFSPSDLARLQTILTRLNADFAEPLALAALADSVGLSREGCCRFFRRMTGQTLSQYLEQYRIAHALSLLQGGGRSITDIALACGFSNVGRFCAAFKRRMHCTPGAYMRRLTASE